MKKNSAKFVYVLMDEAQQTFIKTLKADTDNIVDARTFPNPAAAKKFISQHRLQASHTIYRATMNILLVGPM